MSDSLALPSQPGDHIGVKAKSQLQFQRSIERITDRVLPEPLLQFRDIGSIDLVVRRTGLGVWQASLCDASWLVLGIIFFTVRSG